MIKTIDTRNITTAMLKAQDVIDGTTTYSDPLSFKDAADIFIAMAEAAPAVEPAQAVKTFWASENILKDSLRDNISCILTTTKCAANTVPLYTVPPAIDETRHKLILVCEYLETVGLMFVSPRVISSQIRAILEAGNGE